MEKKLTDQKDRHDELDELKSASDSGKGTELEILLNPNASPEAEEPETPSLLFQVWGDTDIVELEEQGGSPTGGYCGEMPRSEGQTGLGELSYPDLKSGHESTSFIANCAGIIPMQKVDYTRTKGSSTIGPTENTNSAASSICDPDYKFGTLSIESSIGVGDFEDSSSSKAEESGLVRQMRQGVVYDQHDQHIE